MFSVMFSRIGFGNYSFEYLRGASPDGSFSSARSTADCSPLRDLFDVMLLLKAVLIGCLSSYQPASFSLSVWVFHVFETLYPWVLQLLGQIQLTSFRKEAKKGSAKAAVLIVKDTYSQCQAQCTNHSVLPQFWTSKAHLVFTLKDKAPSVNFLV